MRHVIFVTTIGPIFSWLFIITHADELLVFEANRVAEVSLLSNKTYKNPFIEVELDAIVSAEDLPNIVYIALEDISPMMGCYGDEDATTPVFDKPAEESIRYNPEAASQSPRTHSVVSYIPDRMVISDDCTVIVTQFQNLRSRGIFPMFYFSNVLFSVLR